MNFLKNLQEKPRTAKIKILWLTVILITFLILTIWLTVLLPHNLSKLQKEEIFKKDNKNLIPKELDFKNFEAQLSEFKDLLKSQEKNLQPQIEEEFKEELQLEENFYVEEKNLQPHLQLEENNF